MNWNFFPTLKHIQILSKKKKKIKLIRQLDVTSCAIGGCWASDKLICFQTSSFMWHNWRTSWQHYSSFVCTQPEGLSHFRQLHCTYIINMGQSTSFQSCFNVYSKINLSTMAQKFLAWHKTEGVISPVYQQITKIKSSWAKSIDCKAFSRHFSHFLLVFLSRFISIPLYILRGYGNSQWTLWLK